MNQVGNPNCNYMYSIFLGKQLKTTDYNKIKLSTLFFGKPT